MIFIDGKGMGSSTPNKHLYMLSNEADIQLIYCYITSSLSLSLSQGKVQLISLEALRQLQIFIFLLAIFHVIFCVSTMVLGGVRVIYWCIYIYIYIYMFLVRFSVKKFLHLIFGNWINKRFIIYIFFLLHM